MLVSRKAKNKRTASQVRPLTSKTSSSCFLSSGPGRVFAGRLFRTISISRGSMTSSRTTTTTTITRCDLVDILAGVTVSRSRGRTVLRVHIHVDMKSAISATESGGRDKDRKSIVCVVESGRAKGKVIKREIVIK